ncbi:hypothetical protein [Salinimonas sediminis]|uniref:Uncharacterized protein n=1 Tax=Salinimonas sediminis TaxID=2303538 RepID=A0A346NLP1_9ALTE|nr:hypothetical protein [Salinimonas sediminis]AXR06448.1 hypothetical protein D0Y50_08760 [Salinimonas sediminis]
MSDRSTLDEMRDAVMASRLTQIAAVFETEQDARESVSALTTTAHIDAQQITLIDPQDSDFGRKIEDDSNKLGKHMWRAHLWLGAFGLALGLAVAWALVNFGPQLTQNNPLFTYIAMISPGIFVGLFVAGLISLRPDRSEIIDTVRHALRRKHYAVVVNLRKNQSAAKISELLSHRSHKVVEAIS